MTFADIRLAIMAGQALKDLIDRWVASKEKSGELTAEQAAEVRAWQRGEAAQPHWFTDEEIGG